MNIINHTNDVFDNSKYVFKNNIELFDYQKKTIITLMEHEIGQIKIEIPIFKLSTLQKELSNKDYTFSNNFARDIKRFLSSNDQKFILKNNMNSIDKFNVKANFGYNIGVLSNTVGSGKTFVVLGLIMRNKFFKKTPLKTGYKKKLYENSNYPADMCDLIADYLVEKNSFSVNISSHNIRNNNNLFRSNYYTDLELINKPRHIIKSNLIIVPHNLFEQWKQEINKTYLKAFFIKDKRNIINIKETLLNDNYNIVLCNVNKVKELLNQLPNEEYNFERVFIDEADVIHLPHFPELNCNFLWLITTTYTRILSPKNAGFIDNLFHSNYYSTTTHKKFYKFLLEKLTFSFDKDHVSDKLKLSVPNKNYIIVKNNFINSLFYSLNKTVYYKFLNSYDYENLYTYMSRFRGNGMFYFFLRFLFMNVLNMGNIVEQNVIEQLILNTQFHYENESSIFFIYLIQRLHFINFDIIEKKIKPRISKICRMSADIKKHVITCSQCFVNFGETNIKDFLSFNFISHDFNDLNDFFSQNKQESWYSKCHINVDQLKYKIHSLQNAYKQLRTEIDEVKYIKAQLVQNGYCTRCMNKHNSVYCTNGIILNLFNILNVDFTNFDNFIINIDSFHRYKFVREIIYEKTIVKKDLDNLEDYNSNPKLEQMIISLKRDISDKKRCLVFSDNNYFFKNIIIQLNLNSISHRTLKGNTNTINSIIRKYKNHDINVLLLNMKHCGSGINLEMSDNIYIMNFLDKDMETQVIGRVNRIGKKNELNINYYLSTNEYGFSKTIISSDTKSNIIIEEI